MRGQNPLIAMKDVAVLVPDTEIEVSLYAAFCHGLGEQEELNLEQRAALATALDAFRAAYHAGWVDGTAFVTQGEAVFIPAVAWRAGHPEALAVRVPLTHILAVETVRALWRDTLTVRTVKGRFQLRAFMARRFGARLERACIARLGRVSAGGLHPQAA
jgi:hypothetical protein